MNTLRLLRYSRIGLRSFFYVLVFLTFVVWCLAMYFGTSRPTSPISADGKIYPYYFHGKIVYLTKFESFIVRFDIWILLLCVTVAVGFVVKRLETFEARKKRSS
jgi:hypothetical protein